MPKSIKIALITFLIFVGILTGMKLLLRQDKWLYIRIALVDQKPKLIEKPWLDINGRWYTKSEDDSTFSQVGIDDKNWPTERFIYIGQVKGGKGIKWFRKHFTVPKLVKEDTVLLRLSVFDIHCKVFLNGKYLADSGMVFNHSACFKLPVSYLKKGKNLIAVRANMEIKNTTNINRITDEIIIGLSPGILLEGNWKFAKGDIYAAKNWDYDDTSWGNIKVPGKWESLGYKNYDGFAWYRKKFIAPAHYKNQQLVFMGGKIDDFNEIYINGQKIGGNVFQKYNYATSDNYDTYNLYRFEGSLLKDTNIVAVRVLDKTIDGGIYEGPVGILGLDEFINFFKNNN